jgi:hypothetical protein
VIKLDTDSSLGRRHVVTGVLAVLIVLALARILRSGCGGSGFEEDATPADKFAEVWGDEIASLLEGGGQVLLVSTEYARNAEHARARTGGLTTELKRRGIQVREHAVHRSAQFGPMPAPDPFPREWFLGILEDNRRVDAVIMVSSVPALDPEDVAALAEDSRVFVFAADTMDVGGAYALLEAGLLRLAFLPRSTPLPDDQAADPDSPRGWFDLYYEIVYP